MECCKCGKPVVGNDYVCLDYFKNGILKVVADRMWCTSCWDAAVVVSLEVPPLHVKLLRNWASVSRTLTQARDLLLSGEFPDEEVALACVSELESLTPAMDSLHSTVRNQIINMEMYASPDSEIGETNA